MSSLYRLFSDFFRASPEVKVGDLVQVTQQVADLSPTEALIVVNVARITDKWTLIDVIRPGTCERRPVDLAWLQKWDGASP